jgi:WD40 repeat protein
MNKIQVNKIHTFTGHTDCVYALEPEKNTTQFFSAAGDGMVVLWDIANPGDGQLIAKVPHSIYALHQLENGLLVVAQNNQGIHVLDWQQKREVGSLQLGATSVFDLKSYEEILFVAQGDGTITSVNPTTLQVLGKIKLSEVSARTLAINPVRRELAVGYSDHHIRIFDFDLKLKHEWKAHNNSVFTLQYTPDHTFLLSGSRDARLKLWDASASYLPLEEVVAHMYAINHITFSPGGRHFATCSMDKSIKVWDAATLTLLKVIDRARHAGHGTSVNKLYWSGVENRLISASDDRSISVWNIIF